MDDSPGKTRLVVGFALAGLLSGILSLLATWTFGEAATFLFGTPFGLAIAACLAIFIRQHSLTKAVLITVTSTAACIASYFATVFAYEATFQLLDGDPKHFGHPPAYIMFVGGVVGALCPSGVALFLYSPDRLRLLRRSLQCSLAGGISAVTLYAIGSIVEGGLFSSPHPADYPGAMTLFVLWPAAMGAVLAVALDLQPLPESEKDGYWPGNQLAEADSRSESTPSPASESRLTSIVGWIFIAFICAGFLLFIARIFWTNHELARQRRLRTEYEATRPPAAHLPALEPMNEQDVLIVEPIAGTTPRPIGRSIQKAWLGQPEFVEFRMCYMRLSTESCGGNPLAIDLEVVQYPNSDWADYITRGKAFGPGVGYHAPHQLVKSGRILAFENPRAAGHGEFYWRSGNLVVTIRSDIPDPDPFIRAYFEKFPSTD